MKRSVSIRDIANSLNLSRNTNYSITYSDDTMSMINALMHSTIGLRQNGASVVDFLCAA